MLIEFVPNPQFQPPAPAIRVGSVVKTMDGYKRFIEHIDKQRGQYDLWGHGWHTRDFFEPLPERVSGWDENGPQFSPINPPPTSFSWEQYPPKAGMVVEWGHCRCVLLGTAISLESFNGDGVRMGQGGPLHFQNNYRPRPDLMPRFVQQEPTNGKP